MTRIFGWFRAPTVRGSCSKRLSRSGILRKGGRQNFDRHVPATLGIACTAAFLSEAEDALPLPAKSNPKTPSVMSFKNKSRTGRCAQTDAGPLEIHFPRLMIQM